MQILVQQKEFFLNILDTFDKKSNGYCLFDVLIYGFWATIFLNLLKTINNDNLFTKLFLFLGKWSYRVHIRSKFELRNDLEFYLIFCITCDYSKTVSAFTIKVYNFICYWYFLEEKYK
jgi:hypothetical protein